MSTLAERLVYLMENVDMKQTELANKVGISKQSLYKYLHCNCEPRAEIIAKMALALNSSADFIVGLTNDSTPVHRSNALEQEAKNEVDFIKKYRKLSSENKIRIEERMDMMLENK